jgi:DNA-binding NarL/FixJ family response regulator
MKPAISELRELRFGIATDEPASAAGLSAAFSPSDRYRLVWLPVRAEALVAAAGAADVILIDMAAGLPADIVPRLRAAGCDAPVIVWTRDERRVDGDGSTAVLDKRAPLDAVAACVETLAAGRPWTPPELPGAIEGATESRPSESLSRREAELMRLIAQGLSNREVAGRMGLTVGSVKVYSSRLFRKIGVADRVGLALYTLRPPRVPGGSDAG